MRAKFNARVALVNPPGNVLIDEHLEPPLGLLSIASYIKDECAVRPAVLDLTRCSVEEAEDVLGQFEADIYGFTVYCTKWDLVKRLIARVRALRPEAIIVVGGPNPTALPQETLQFEPINLVVCGEGEKAFRNILEAHQRGKLSGGHREIVHGERLTKDEFPLLDRTFVEPPENYGRRCFGRPVITLEASRGCSNRCIFCNSTAFRDDSKRGAIAKATEKIVQEVSEAKACGFDTFRFNDDSFADAACSGDLLERLAEMQIKYRIFANVKHLSEELLQKLRQSGCFHISVGIESYNPDNLRVLGKGTSQGDIRTGVNRASEMGFVVRAYFIVGLPFDTPENVPYYMRLVTDEVRFAEYSIYPLIPYPGSRIWTHPEEYGYTLTNRDFNQYVQIGKGNRTAFALKHKNFDEVDIASWLALSDQLFKSRGKIQTLQSKVI